MPAGPCHPRLRAPLAISVWGPPCSLLERRCRSPDKGDGTGRVGMTNSVEQPADMHAVSKWVPRRSPKPSVSAASPATRAAAATRARRRRIRRPVVRTPPAQCRVRRRQELRCRFPPWRAGRGPLSAFPVASRRVPPAPLRVRPIRSATREHMANLGCHAASMDAGPIVEANGFANLDARVARCQE